MYSKGDNCGRVGRIERTDRVEKMRVRKHWNYCWGAVWNVEYGMGDGYYEVEGKAKATYNVSIRSRTCSGRRRGSENGGGDGDGGRRSGIACRTMSERRERVRGVVRSVCV